MGFLLSLCSKEPDDNLTELIPGEQEINLPNYSSTSDKYFSLVENKYNLIKNIQLFEYMNLLEHYSIETATIKFEGKYRYDFSSKDPFLDSIMHQIEFQSFIENKLLTVNSIAEIHGEDIQTISLFKECLMKIFSALNLRLNNFYKNKNKNEENIKKLNLIALGMLYCRGKNINKIKLFFDLFKNDNNMFIKSEKLDDYLISAFFIASYCLVSVRAFIDNEEKGLPKIDNKLMVILLNEKGLSQKYCENLLKFFNENFFGEKQELNWDEFKNKFICNEENDDNKSFGWLFSTEGIRSKLEDKNIMN